MKKIIALILSLLMVACMAVTAFAVEENTVVYGVDENKHVDKNAKKAFEITLIKAASYEEGGGHIAHYSYWTEDEEFFFLVPCEQKDADYAIYKDGAFFTWVKEDDMTSDGNIADLAIYDTVAKVQKETSDKPGCTTSQFLADGYIDKNDHFYIADDEGTVALNVDGIVVKTTDVTGQSSYVIAASHVFAKGITHEAVGYDIVRCLICGRDFACTNDEMVATKAGFKISDCFDHSTDEMADVYESRKYDDGYDFHWGQTYAGDYAYCWALESNAAVASIETTLVESAKTFDGGVAVYGLLALSSALSMAAFHRKRA